MSEAANPQPKPQQNAESSPSTEVPPGQPPSPSSAAEGATHQPTGPAEQTTKGTLRGAGLRYGEQDDVPQWARGKTADEILQTADAIYNAWLQQQPPQPAAAPQPQPTQPTSMQPTPQGVQPPDPELQYSNAAEYQRQLIAYNDARWQQQLQQASAPFVNSQAQIARDLSRTDPDFKDVWDRYGPEIDALVQQIPLQQRIDKSVWNQAAEMIAGRHRKELARLEAERLASQPQDAGTVGSGSVSPPSGGSAARDEIEQLFSEGSPAVEHYLRAGMDARRVKEHAAKMGHSPAAYAEILKRRTNLTPA